MDHEEHLVYIKFRWKGVLMGLPSIPKAKERLTDPAWIECTISSKIYLHLLFGLLNGGWNIFPLFKFSEREDLSDLFPSHLK